MVLDYPETQLYILFAVSITFFGGVVLSEKLKATWIHMLLSFVFVAVSWASVAFVFGGKFLELGVEFFLSDISWETRLHAFSLLLFFLSFLAVFFIRRREVERVFSKGDEAEGKK